MPAVEGPVPVRFWGDMTMQEAKSIGVKLLQGVGEGEWFHIAGDYAIHVRRKLTEQEKSLIPRAWLDAPAIDEG